MTPGINVDNLGTGGGTATVAGIKQIVASNATLTSGSVTITGTGEGITVNTAAGPTIRISGAQTGVKHLVASGNTFSSGTVSITGSGNVQVSSSASGIIVSGSQSTQPGVQDLAASNNEFTSGTVSITGAGEGITVNTAASKIQISGSQTGVKNLYGGTDGPFSSGTVSITGLGNVTVNTAASKIQISGSQSTGVQALSVLNTEGASLFSSGTVSISGIRGFSVGSVGGNLVLKQGPPLGIWENMPQDAITHISNLSAFSKTPFYVPIQMPGNMESAASIGLRMSAVNTATLQSFTAHFGIYTYVNSTSIASITTKSFSFHVAVNSSASWSGVRDWVLQPAAPVASVMNSASNYVLGFMFSAGATGSMNLSLYGRTLPAANRPLGIIGTGAQNQTTENSAGVNPMLGQGSSTVNALPSDVSAGDLVNQGSQTMPILPYIFIRS